MRPWLLALLLCAPAITASAEPAELATAGAAATRLTFAPGHARLTAGREALKPIASTMQAKTALRILIVAHGESDLAKRRADVVKWALIEGGVESDRIDTRVNASPGNPVEMRFLVTAARRELAVRATPATRPAPARAEPLVRSEPRVRTETVRAKSEVRAEPASASDDPSVAHLLADANARRHTGFDLDAQIAALHDAPVTIGGSSSGSRDTAAPQLAIRPLELSIATAAVPVAVPSSVERPVAASRIRYGTDGTPDAEMRANIRAQRHGK